MSHHDNHAQNDPDPTGLALKLLLYSVAGAVFYLIMMWIFVR